jgi:DNA-binding IclR family transcriptional regulator
MDSEGKKAATGSAGALDGVREDTSLPSLENEDRVRDSGTSLAKMLSILDLFSQSNPVWSTNDVIDRLGTSRSTGYRYIKELHAAGLLGAVGNGYYVLGPRIVELDLQIRECDPLHIASKGILEQLVAATGHSALLCMLFSNSVLCIREHLAPLSPERMFSRGQRRPLYKGAMSKVILAHLPSHRLRSIYARNQTTVSESRMGNSWDGFRDYLGKVRRDGYLMTFGEFNPGVYGVAAPVFNDEKLILGSIGVAWQKEELPEVDITKTVLAVKRAAREVTSRMASVTNGMGLPPRAVG